MSLTGKTRYRNGRSGFRRVLILQVQEVVRRCEPVGPFVDCCDVLEWRDARVEDLPLPLPQPTS